MSHQPGMHTAHSCGKGSAAALIVDMKALHSCRDGLYVSLYYLQLGIVSERPTSKGAT